MERLRNFFTGGDPAPSNPGDTYDISGSFRVPSKKKREKKSKRSWKRRASDETSDSMWSWSQAGNIVSNASAGFNRKGSNDSHRTRNSGSSIDVDDKSHASGGTFDNSWLGLGNSAEKNGRGGSNWQHSRRTSSTPFVDFDGNSFHSQRSTPYQLGERNLKRCIGIMFVLAIVVLSGALIGINITSKNDTIGKPLTKGTPSSALTEEEKLAIAESVNSACSPSSIDRSNGRHKCQQICHDHFCCFDSSENGYNCQGDAGKFCSVYAGCVVLVQDLMNGGSAPTEIDHVDSATLASRVHNACSDVKTSMGQIECHQACDDHMCCFDSDSNKNCRGDEKMECFAYEACSVLPAVASSDKGSANAAVDKPAVPLPSWDTDDTTSSGNAAPSLPKWDTAEIASGGESDQEVQKIDYTSDESTSIGDAVNSDGDESTNQVLIPSLGSGSIIASSEGVTEQDIDSVCQNVEDPNDKTKCAKLCVDHMCCFESDEEKSCLSNSDCSVYGSCVLLGSNFAIDFISSTDDYEPTSANDEYSYDDDMFVVDTEADGGEDDAYESTVFHLGNRTVIASNEAFEEEETLAEGGSLVPIQNEDDDDIYVVDTEDEEEDPYDSTLYQLGERSLRGLPAY